MHRHLSTGSVTIAALMAVQTWAAPASARPPADTLDVTRLLASMGDHGSAGAGPREVPAPRPG